MSVGNDGAGLDRFFARRQKHHLPRGVAPVPVNIGYADAPTITIDVRFVTFLPKMLAKPFGNDGNMLVGIHPRPSNRCRMIQPTTRQDGTKPPTRRRLGLRMRSLDRWNAPTAASRLGVPMADPATAAGLTSCARLAAFISAKGKALAPSAVPTSEGVAR